MKTEKTQEIYGMKTCLYCKHYKTKIDEFPCADCSQSNNGRMGYSANLWEPVDHEENANDTQKEIPAENLERNVYRDSIVALIDRQREKGLKKYGVTLEHNTTLTTEQRIEHAEEELIDALQYLEHLKVSLADKMTANDYQRAAMRTASGMNYDQVGGNGLLLNGVMGLNGEAGECIDIVKKHFFQGHVLDREHLIEELGDAAWYLAVSCEAVGVTLGEVMQRNVDKLKKRYPDGFDKSRSIKREETNDQTGTYIRYEF